MTLITELENLNAKIKKDNIESENEGEALDPRIQVKRLHLH